MTTRKPKTTDKPVGKPPTRPTHPAPPALKRCAGPCHEEKPLTQFARAKAAPDGKQSVCRACKQKESGQGRAENDFDEYFAAVAITADMFADYLRIAERRTREDGVMDAWTHQGVARYLTMLRDLCDEYLGLCAAQGMLHDVLRLVEQGA